MISMSDRRLTPRFNLKIPFIFCSVNTPLERGHLTQTINISNRGVLFETEHAVFLGLPVHVLVQMPRQCGGKPGTLIVYTGRVSHVMVKRRGQRKAEVGIEFFYSEELDGCRLREGAANREARR